MRAGAAAPEVSAADLPRVPPTAPDKAVATLQVKPGFRMELVAAEPLVVDPVAMCFDENGQLFVVEMRDYSERRPERLGRIRRLVDSDGDGRFDKSTVYVDHLPWPTALFCYDGGLFVGATPDIFFCRDTNDDGVSDTQELIFTGFAYDSAPYETNRLNVQAMLNSFQWGLDNRIHGATSMGGARVTSPKFPERPPLTLRGRDFSFDPRTLQIRAESGGGQHGMSFNNAGRKFICSNSSHCQAVLYEDRYASANPFHALPPAADNIAVDGPAAEVFRRSPDEPWRVLRTQWRVAGVVPGPIEGGGRASGYFTGATGITIYRGHAWPEEHLGDAFIADCGSNLIHRKKVHDDLLPPKASRPADEQRIEFATSTDNWFRPVQFANAPDGTLYVADMYREVIEHPWSLPAAIKKHLDLNSGNDRGRIYRIIPDGFTQPPLPKLAQASTAEVVQALAHPNGWHRDTAARLLYQRQDKAAPAMINELLARTQPMLGRLHALYALDGMQSLKPDSIIAGLSDQEALLREHAVRLAPRVRHRSSPVELEKINQLLCDCASDPNLRVRYQLAWTLTEVDLPEKSACLARLANSAKDQPWLQAAILNASKTNAAALVCRVAEAGSTLANEEGRLFVRQLAAVAGAEETGLRTIVTWAENSGDHDTALLIMLGLSEGLTRTGKILAGVISASSWKRFVSMANSVALDDRRSIARRQEAVRFLGNSSYREVSPVLSSLLAAEQLKEMQQAALSTLARYQDAEVAALLLGHWDGFGREVRQATLAVLLARPERIISLLDALKDNPNRSAELSSTQVQFLREHRDATIRERARLQLRPRDAVRDKIVEEFRPALALGGNAAPGQEIFVQRCAACHRMAGEGHALGPDLASVRSSGKETLLANILDPNREVSPQYKSFEVETKSGDTYLGVLGNETGTHLTVRQANGNDIVLGRPDILRSESRGQSVMPEGLEVGLSLQNVADLLEFILSAPAK